jgi:hypothetical protein
VDEISARASIDRLRFHAEPVPLSTARRIDWVRTVRALLMVGLVAYAVAFTARAYYRNYFIFLPDYGRWMFTPASSAVAGKPTHVFLFMGDHFEPTWDSARVQEWARRYGALAARHHDSTGRPPQHDWFYPGEQFSQPIFETMQSMAAAGYGEVELHYHHAWDTYETLQDTLKISIAKFQEFGFLKTVDGKTAFAFIHGNWGLDNSNGDELCGVNREIELLHNLGSFADFTFPSIYENSQPRTVNSIFAVHDDDGPKSYDRKLPLSALADGTGQLMMFEGPLIFTPTLSPRQMFLYLDDGDIHAAGHASPSRADSWVRANVHVPERPDWVFIKLFSHGVTGQGDMDSVLGPDFDATLSYLEREYNDGQRYVLHYITAREAYNLARSAAEGAKGEPQQYMDAYIKPFVANAHRRAIDAQ